MHNVLIVGCGVIGVATVYQLSRYDLSVCVCRRYNDTANGCTKANTVILHAGFDRPTGGMEARLNIRGIKLAEEICEKLDVERIPMPTFIIAYDNPHELNYIEKLYKRGVTNGAEGVRIVDYDEALRLESRLNSSIKAALYAPGSAIINPWEYCIIMAETTVRNGANLKLESEATVIEKKDDYFVAITNSGVYEAKYVVNVGGGWSAQVYNLIGGNDLYQTNFVGQYFVLDKSQGNKLHSVVFLYSDEHGFKGACVTPTVHGSPLVGPDCCEVPDGDHVGTDPAASETLKTEGHRSMPGIDFREIIRECVGVRPSTQIPDFVIGESPVCSHFISLAGTKSPGLSSAPSIAEEAESTLRECGLEVKERDEFIDSRKRIIFRHLSDEEKQEVIKNNPLYGRIICHRETVAEDEITEAVHRPIVPRTIGAIKRRRNAGMGCRQGGFCGPRVHEILARELGVSQEEILMDEQGSFIITPIVKERR